MACAPTAHEIVLLFRSGQIDALRPALARFVLANEEAIRKIARERMFACTRNILDTDDLMCTVLRRIDRLVEKKRFSPASEEDVWGLLQTVAHHSAITKNRLVQRTYTLSLEGGPYARWLLERVNRCVDNEEVAALLTRLMLAIPTTLDRQMFSLRLRGTTHRVTAQLLGISEVAARKRWSELMAFLQECVKKWEAQ